MMRKLWGPLRGDLTAKQMTVRVMVWTAFCAGALFGQWLLYFCGAVK